MASRYMPASVGVICEFNPLHNGHVYLLSKARELVGEDGVVVCVMSGRSVQRGELAMADPYLRGQTAILGGADLVVELPFPWCSGSAEVFAKAGVHILHEMGVKNLLFGSECGDLSLLSLVANLIQDSSFGDIYADLCTQGIGTALAYQKAISIMVQRQGLSLPDGFPSSNDLLGVAYLSAMEGFDMTPHTIKRQGQAYHDTLLTDTAYPSATSLRLLIGEAYEDIPTLSAMLDGTMPSSCLDALMVGVGKQTLPVFSRPLMTLYHAYFRLWQDTMPSVAELCGGLDRYLHKVALQTNTPQAFWAQIQTKQYTEARLRRGMLFALTGVTPEDLSCLPVYTTLFSANDKGCGWVSLCRKQARFPIVTKPADAPHGRQRELCEQIDALFTLCMPCPSDSGMLVRKSPYIEKSKK